MREKFTHTLLSMVVLGLAFECHGASSFVSAAYMTPSNPWENFPTRIISDLPDYRPADTGALSRFGGAMSQPRKASSFFRVEKVGTRWWFIDPLGYRFINTGVVGVSLPERLAQSRRLKSETWGMDTVSLLREQGFNGVGAWSDTAAVSTSDHPFVYTRLLNFMGTYASKRGILRQEGGRLRYPQNVIPVFHPGFPAFCEEFARQLDATRDDPWMLGTFSDNELPFQRAALDNYLLLPPDDPGRIAAEAWLKERRSLHPGENAITDAMREEFLGFIIDHYLAITTAAIRRHDPNHLCLGSRFHGQVLGSAAAFAAAGKHLDVIAINYYHAWSPDPKLMRRWGDSSGRPFLITEWYAKAMDSGFPNTSGAGWVVKTQVDRGRFYQNFALGLLESENCVGWHWFKYQDNDPSDPLAGFSNTDSNKGIVNLDFKPYTALTDAMKDLNRQTYSLVNYFDARRK